MKNKRVAQFFKPKQCGEGIENQFKPIVPISTETEHNKTNTQLFGGEISAQQVNKYKYKATSKTYRITDKYLAL